MEYQNICQGSIEMKRHLITIKSKEDNTSSDSVTEIIFRNLKGKFLEEAIASYKNKCYQYIK